MILIVERLIALHRALAGQRIPHAFGGAIALGYWTVDPRGTSDIDVNLFVPAADCERVLQALPDEITQPAETVEKIVRDGQVRLRWEGDVMTPIDLFFENVPVHADAERHSQIVPFGGIQIPILGPVELAVFKAMFDRTQDWADIEAMIAAGTLDVDAARTTLETMLGDKDPRLTRLAEVAAEQGRLSDD